MTVLTWRWLWAPTACTLARWVGWVGGICVRQWWWCATNMASCHTLPASAGKPACGTPRAGRVCSAPPQARAWLCITLRPHPTRLQGDLPAAAVRRMIGPDAILGVSVKTVEEVGLGGGLAGCASGQSAGPCTAGGEGSRQQQGCRRRRGRQRGRFSAPRPPHSVTRPALQTRCKAGAGGANRPGGVTQNHDQSTGSNHTVILSPLLPAAGAQGRGRWCRLPGRRGCVPNRDKRLG